MVCHFLSSLLPLLYPSIHPPYLPFQFLHHSPLSILRSISCSISPSIPPVSFPVAFLPLPVLPVPLLSPSLPLSFPTSILPSLFHSQLKPSLQVGAVAVILITWALPTSPVDWPRFHTLGDNEASLQLSPAPSIYRWLISLARSSSLLCWFRLGCVSLLSPTSTI